MKKKLWIIIGIAILAIIILIAIFSSPSEKKIEQCKNGIQPSMLLKHISDCHKACCEKSIIKKYSCNKFCNSIN